MRLVVLPGVFHPGFFRSTKNLLDHISTIDFKDKAVLDLGAGTGILAVYCALKGAKVTASDVSLKATLNIDKNSRWNRIVINNIHSDLFTNIPSQKFDCILINPPFLKTDPQTDADYSCAAGKEYAFFSKLFSTIRNYIHDKSNVLICVPETGDTQLILQLAEKFGFSLKNEVGNNNPPSTTSIFSLT